MAEYNPSKIIKDGNTYNFRDTTKIPLAGSNQISGSLIPATSETVKLGSESRKFSHGYMTNLFATHLTGTADHGIDINFQYGANLILRGKNYPNSNEVGNFLLVADNGTNSTQLIGKPSNGGNLIWNGNLITPDVDGRFSIGTSSEQVWAIYTHYLTQSSDRRLKKDIKLVDANLLDAWENIDIVQFKFKNTQSRKIDNDLHIGYIAQDIQEKLAKHDIDASEYGLFCHDSWEEQAEVSHEETYTEEVQTKSGEKQTVTKTRKVIDTPYKAKGDSYGLRYTECLVVECAYLRKKNKELQEQLDKLSARLDKLESASSK